jgi:ATP-dependent helicase/nuclease subunit A
MYVAATRARQTLYLSAAPRVRKDGGLEPDSRSLLACLWPTLQTHFQPPPPAEPAADTTSASPQRLRRLRDEWRAPELPAAPALPRLPLQHASLTPPEFSWVGETQRHIGTIVHAWLARAALAGAIPGAGPEGQRREALELLRLYGVPERERPQAAQLIVNALERTWQDERGRWLLSAAHREAASELALTGIAGGRLRSVKIDRSFIDEHGTRWVIDYKTSSHQGGDLEGFLARELERYQPQLAMYMELARAMGPQPVRAALYFPLLGAFREL